MGYPGAGNVRKPYRSRPIRVTPRVELSAYNSSLLVLSRLETFVNGATAREVEHALLQIDETRLTSGQIEATLGFLHTEGMASAEGPIQYRSFLITESGRERLRSGRA